MDLVFLAALGAIVVGFVLYPVFYREALALPSGPGGELERLAEKKERILAAMKDLEFEYRAGKLSEEDYQRVRGADMTQVAGIMTRMDELTRQQSTPATEHKRKRERKKTTGPDCPSCGQGNPPESKFCLRCGTRIVIPVKCPQCGTQLPADARFCTECGAKARA